MASQGNPGTHVTVVGVLETIWGSVVGLMGLLLVLMGATLGATIEAALKDAGGFGALLGAGIVIVGLIMTLIGAGAIIASIGLYKRRSWGRILTFVYAGLAVLSGASSLMIMDVAGAVVALGWAGYAIWSLTRPQVVAQFQGDPVRRGPTAV